MSKGYAQGLVLCIFLLGKVALGDEVKITASDGAAGDWFARSVAICGDYAVVEAPYNDNVKGIDAGSAYIFHYDGNTWTEQEKLMASDGIASAYFGYSVDIYVVDDNDIYVIVGAPYDDNVKGTDAGSAYIFHYDGNSWTQQQKLIAPDGAPNDNFGHSVGIYIVNENNMYAVVGAPDDDNEKGSFAGSAYMFKQENNIWGYQQKLMAGDGADGDYFGFSVGIYGINVIVGALYDDNGNGTNAGSAYIFYYHGVWTQKQKLMAGDGAECDNFGYSVSLCGSYALVGAPCDDNGNGTDAGSAYVFYYDGDTWIQQQKLMAGDGAEDDNFGYSVDIYIANNIYAIVGAPYEDEKGTDAGAAYTFLCSGITWNQTKKQMAGDGAAYDHFGFSVSIYGDYAIIGAIKDDVGGNINQGSAYIYRSIEDLSLPVELASFTATAGEGWVTLSWCTESEVDNLGFHVYRALSPEGPYSRITKYLIPGTGNSALAHEYSFVDREVEPGVTYWYKLEEVAFDGAKVQHGPVKAIPVAPISLPNLKLEEEEVPTEDFLSPNWPNPFNSDTYIRFGISSRCHVRLVIYNVLGQRVRALVDGELGANIYTVYWDGRDDVGMPVSSGVYLCMLQVGNFLRFTKMVLLR